MITGSQREVNGALVRYTYTPRPAVPDERDAELSVYRVTTGVLQGRLNQRERMGNIFFHLCLVLNRLKSLRIRMVCSFVAAWPLPGCVDARDVAEADSAEVCKFLDWTGREWDPLRRGNPRQQDPHKRFALPLSNIWHASSLPTASLVTCYQGTRGVEQDSLGGIRWKKYLREFNELS